jgi:glycosyltransferase involved in cell wall biosynthesis
MKPIVYSLNYHEVTKDPRVMKQARALVAAGYDVTVFCDWPDGMPEKEVIDGVKIVRFHCFSHENIARDTLDNFKFLKRSRPVIGEAFNNFADKSASANRSRAEIEKFFGETTEVYFKRYYRNIPHGPERKRLKRLHRKARRVAFLRSFISFSYNRAYRAIFTLKIQSAMAKLSKKGLYQATSLIFACNLARLDIARTPFVIHAHDLYTLPAAVALKQKLGGKIVYDAHEYEPARATKMQPHGNSFADTIEQDCLDHVSAIITVSESIAGLYRQRYVAGPIELVMNVPEDIMPQVRNGEMRNNTANVRDRAGLGPEVPLIVFTGGIQREQRGMDKVLGALKHLESYHLVCLGPRITRNDDWLNDHTRALGVNARVHLLPPVDARLVPETISTADVAICPIQDASLSYRFAMPNKLFEAAHAEIPICVSDFPDMGNFVRELGIGATFDQTDPASIAAAIKKVYENRKDYKMTRSSRRLLEDKYGWASQVKKLLSLYKRLALH